MYEKMKKKLLILGAGGHGKVVADIALKMNRWNYIAFLDDDVSKASIMDFPIIGKLENYLIYKEEFEVFVAIGNNHLREIIQNILIKNDIEIPILIHPNALLGKMVTLGEGTVVMAGAIVNASSVIGIGCIINTGAIIEHDNIISNYVHISPGVNVAGNVTIGSKTWLGIGSNINNGVYITDNCIIGAGAVVISNIIESGTFVGVPARKIKNNG